MTSDKKNISLLADLFEKSGLQNIVISPGSRNAPVIISFANNPNFNCFSIIDERSAAFFALGMALQSKKTTAISCTSGSAALNYSSAISEAFYQKIPLLIITADRPKHLIDIGDGQTIKQKKVFTNFVKKSYELPENIDGDKNFEKAQKIINKALHNCMFPEPGPVHINIPFNEPIYGTTEENICGKLLDINTPIIPDNSPLFNELANDISVSKKVMIIAGQQQPNTKLNSVIIKLSELNNLVILTETTSNIHGNNIIDTIDNVVSTISKKETESFKPDILISFGGHIVSKMIKKFLRANKPRLHYHISPSGEKMDTYACLTHAIKENPNNFFESIFNNLEKDNSGYSELWLTRKETVSSKRDSYHKNLDFCDLKVFDYIINNLYDGTILHLGNSTPIRYSQLFGTRKNIVYQSNRGVSGIDGQVSTATGYSHFSDHQNLLITGDLGFLYDSNGLMNHYQKSGLKIIVINNQGGGIFRFIPGPDTTPNLEQFFEARHNWNAKYICKAFNVEYFNADENNAKQKITDFLNSTSQQTQLLEIFTPSDKNGELLRDYFTNLI